MKIFKFITLFIKKYSIKHYHKIIIAVFPILLSHVSKAELFSETLENRYIVTTPQARKLDSFLLSYSKNPEEIQKKIESSLKKKRE